MAKRMVANDRPVLDTRLVLQVLTSVKKGDFTARLPANWTGVDGKIAEIGKVGFVRHCLPLSP